MLASPRDQNAPISQSGFDRHWRAARDEVKPGLRFHDLRHLGLTAFARAGATSAELVERGGHKSISVAARYPHASRERDRALTDCLDDLIQPS